MAGSARRVLRSPEITLIPAKPTGQVNGMPVPCSPPGGQPPPPLQFPTETFMGPGLSTTVGHNYSQGLSTAGTTTATTTAVIGESTGSGAGGCVSIDFNCSIQYSHMLNRDANTLQILIQRRKKYKSKTMNLGYKTLAYCNVNLAQVLQRRIENRFLELYTDPKCSTHPIGRVEVQCLSTSPIEKDLMNGKRKVVDEDEDFPMPDMYSEESDHGEESDEDQLAEAEETGHSRQKKLVKAMSVGLISLNVKLFTLQQKQIKQKLIGLLKKLKIGDPSEEDLDVAETSKLWDEIDLIATASDMEEEDSEADGTDSISIHSTPKPTLRPFFATTGSSDDTLSADAGTKLLKRLQRELFARGEAEATSGAYYLRSVLPETSLNSRSARLSRGAKKGSVHMTCATNAPGVVGATSSAFTAGTPVGTSVRNSSSALRHHRGNGTGGAPSSSGRLASRLVHMRRRSNLGDSSKQNSASVEVNKQNDSRHPCVIPVTSVSLDGVAPRTGSPTNQDSSDEKGESNGLPLEGSLAMTCQSPRSSMPTDSASLAASSVVDAAFSTATGHMLSSGLPCVPLSASPTLTSTPEANRTHTSYTSRASDGREFSFANLDDMLSEVSTQEASI
ncbi:unnamed protein product [Echinostoma caproni]|uniref:Phosphofurin acidic cluster sorting protein 2 n=1 Tax=Echinostoma caproni TaxID=27848 RepID=A0A183AKH3_9TREM|nr:unnamed protein product [Echinostoma caproni]